MPTAFISRAQSPESEFSCRLQEQGWQVTGRSLVQLSPLAFETIPACDWIFFASQHAVRFFFQQIAIANLAIPPVKWAALGAATANILSAFVAQVDFTGTGDPASSTAAFMGQVAPCRVLFPAARHSMQSIAAQLNEHFTILHLEVYDNQPVADVPLQQEDVLVFTSPMNARAYFTQHPLLPHQKVVAIGATTAAALKHLGIKKVSIAEEANERGVADRVVSPES
ncbi:MAG: uroporphyrinogen-III synthase [Saprospiraceae bacterium]|nr:uroporphyrinogen-III synthase [Saprospiraceae bacterium]